MGGIKGGLKILLGGMGQGLFTRWCECFGVQEDCVFQALLGKWLWRFGHFKFLFMAKGYCHQIWGGQGGVVLEHDGIDFLSIWFLKLERVIIFFFGMIGGPLKLLYPDILSFYIFCATSWMGIIGVGIWDFPKIFMMWN